MKTAVVSLLLSVGLKAPDAVHSFHPPMPNRPASPTTITSNAALSSASSSENNEEDVEFQVRSDSSFRPETSFGAEAVPEEQRPANEYLDLIRQPLFGWASQERGDGGLAARLAATYAAFFVLV